MNPSRKSTRSRRSGFRFLVRLFGWSVSAVVALVVLLYVALPTMLRFGIPHALERYGLVSSVDGARIDLANETLTLVGFLVGFEEGPAIRWGEVTARVDTAALFRGNIRILDFEVKDARVNLEALRASAWKPPARLAAIPELGGLNVDIGDVVLKDLKFIGLSEQLDREVVLRSLEIGGLSHLGSGEQVAFRLEGRVDDASVRLAGRARLENGLPALEGRYELGGLSLAGLGDVDARLERGRLDGTGTVTLAYAGEGTVEAELSGRAGVADLVVNSGVAEFVVETAQWNGEARVAWPVSGGSPRITARGRASSPGIRASERSSDRPLTVEGRGLEWDGAFGYAGAYSLDGALRGESVEIAGAWPGMRTRATGVAASIQRPLGDGPGPLTVSRLTLEQAEISAGEPERRRSAVMSDLAVSDLQAVAGTLRAGRLRVESAEATVAIPGTASPGALDLVALEARGVEVADGARWRFDALEAGQGSLAVDSAVFRLGGARLSGVKAGPAEPLTAEAITAATARRAHNGQEVWVENMRLTGVVYMAPHDVRAEELGATRLSQVAAGEPVWEARGVRLTEVSSDVAAARAASLELDGLVYSGSDGALVELEQARASEAVLAHGVRLDAGALRVDALRYRGAGLVMLEARGAEVGTPAFAFDGGFAADFAESDQIRHTDAAANLTVLEIVHAGNLSGDLSRAVRMDALHVEDLSHDRAGGIHRLRGVDLSRVEVTAGGDVSASTAKITRVEFVLPDETSAELDQIALAEPRWLEQRAAAQGARIRTVRLRAPGGGELRIADIDAGAVTSAADGHHLDALRAGDLQATHAASGARLDGGALELGQVSMFTDGRLGVGTARIDEVSLGHGEEARAGSFSAAAVAVEGFEAPSGGPLEFGHVGLYEPALKVGIDAAGELIMPPWPVFGSGEGPAENVVIQRLETSSPGRLEFFDRSTDPEFRLEVAPLTVRLEGFASGNPDRRARFDIDGSIDSFSKIKAEGTIALGPGGASLELRGRVTGFELERLNSYLAQGPERDIRGGRGDASVDLGVEGGQLSGSAELTLSNVVFEPGGAAPVPAEDERAVAGGDVSLHSTLSMLKDKNDTVRLTVPLSGSLNDPRFDFSDIFVRALMRTLRNTVELTFKPLGLLVTATGIVSRSGDSEFKPVRFEAGESALNGEGLTYLDTLAGRLERHPAVEVGICGRAVPADRIAMERPGAETPPANEASTGEAALEKLAEQRAAAVRRYLEAQHRVRPDRLDACAPRVETTLGALPRVDLPVRVEIPTRAASPSERAGQ